MHGEASGSLFHKATQRKSLTVLWNVIAFFLLAKVSAAKVDLGVNYLTHLLFPNIEIQNTSVAII